MRRHGGVHDGRFRRLNDAEAEVVGRAQNKDVRRPLKPQRRVHLENILIFNINFNIRERTFKRPVDVSALAKAASMNEVFGQLASTMKMRSALSALPTHCQRRFQHVINPNLHTVLRCSEPGVDFELDPRDTRVSHNPDSTRLQNLFHCPRALTKIKFIPKNMFKIHTA